MMLFISSCVMVCLYEGYVLTFGPFLLVVLLCTNGAAFAGAAGIFVVYFSRLPPSCHCEADV